MAKYFRVHGTITRVENSHYEVKYCNDDTDQIPMKEMAAYVKDYFIENNHESQSPVTLDQPTPKRKKKLSSTSSSKKPNKKRRLTQADIDTASKTQRTTHNHGRSQKKMKNHTALSKPDAIDSKKKSQKKRRSNPEKRRRSRKTKDPNLKLWKQIQSKLKVKTITQIIMMPMMNKVDLKR